MKLESDVQHVQADVTDRMSIEELHTEVAKEFGSVRTSIKLWVVVIVMGVGTILSVWGAALALAKFLKP